MRSRWTICSALRWRVVNTAGTALGHERRVWALTSERNGTTVKHMMPERMADTVPTSLPPRSGRDRLAQVVSQVTNPAFVALPTFLVVALRTAPNAGTGPLWWVATPIGLNRAPLLHIAPRVRAGR